AHGARRLAELEIVEADVDRGADLDVGVVDPAAEVEALTIELVGSSEVAQLLVEPAQAVREPPLEEGVVALTGLAEGVVDHGQTFRILAERDVGEARERSREHLEEPVAHLDGRGRGPPGRLES